MKYNIHSCLTEDRWRWKL